MSYGSTTTVQHCCLSTISLHLPSLPYILHVPGANLPNEAIHSAILSMGKRVNAVVLGARLYFYCSGGLEKESEPKYRIRWTEKVQRNYDRTKETQSEMQLIA